MQAWRTGSLIFAIAIIFGATSFAIAPPARELVDKNVAAHTTLHYNVVI
jgi:hypothetical protein